MPSPTGPPRQPPPSTDFRNATIENHWNDPPNAIFKKTESPVTAQSGGDNGSPERVAAVMRSVLNQCESVFMVGPNKRIFQDTQGRINGMLQELEKNEIPDHVVQSLNELSQALEDKDWAKSMDIHTRLMTTEYDKHGSWLIGLKRLVDLAQKASSP